MSSRNLVASHIRCFLGRNIERDLQENLSENIQLFTPIGVFNGAEGVRRFHSILDENLLNAFWDVSDLVWNDEKVEYHWRAEGPTSMITHGTCTAEIKNGKIEKEWIQCRIDPFVTQQG